MLHLQTSKLNMIFTHFNFYHYTIIYFNIINLKFLMDNIYIKKGGWFKYIFDVILGT